jgi:hypothetical protein
MNPTINLYTRVAAVLSGHPGVEVRLRAPIVKDFDGAAYVYGVRSVIDIRPGFSPAVEFRCLLHECGHLRSGTAGKDIDVGLPPETMKLSDIGKWSYKAHPDSIKRESDADRWVAVWSNYADRHYKQYSGGSTVEQKLRCLLSWVPDELAALAQDAGRSAGQKAIKAYLRRQS